MSLQPFVQEAKKRKNTEEDKHCPDIAGFRVKYKTEMCKNWEQTGTCKFGADCAFAHGQHELQHKKHVPAKYKTKLCKSFHEALYCPYGQRCQFLHQVSRAQGLDYREAIQKRVKQAEEH